MSPQRIQRKRTRGWRMPEGAVYVGRGSKFGNPFEYLTPQGLVRYRPDDKLVAQVTASKVYGVRPGARIHIELIGGA